jgi:predicted transcriptional regulator
MPDTRTHIRRSVEAHPGIHFSELTRRLELAPGQVQYHLRRLLRDDTIVAESVYGKTHYYSPAYSGWEREALALLRRETAGAVVGYLLSYGPTAPGTVADDLSIARSTLEWHLDHLVEHDLVTKHHDESNHVTLTVRNADRTVALLRDADPSLRERFVDRFTRLVDRLLEP